jgi:hypothetical protein
LTRREHRRAFWNISHCLLERVEQNHETFRGLVLNMGPPESEAIMPSSAAQRINLYELCVLYIGRAHRYPPNTPFYVFLNKYT